MKIKIRYSKKNLRFSVNLDKYLFSNFLIKKLENKYLLKNISLIVYNYILLLKILRIYGLAKPLINIKDY